jgi:hypothetical protein
MPYTPFERDNMNDSVVLIEAARKMLGRVDVEKHSGFTKIFECLDDAVKTLMAALAT